MVWNTRSQEWSEDQDVTRSLESRESRFRSQEVHESDTKGRLGVRANTETFPPRTLNPNINFTTRPGRAWEAVSGKPRRGVKFKPLGQQATVPWPIVIRTVIDDAMLE